jgi:hypothetical protein
VLNRATGLAFDQLVAIPRPPIDHQSNQLYDVWVAGRHLIVKEFLKSEEWSAAPRREFDALTLLAPLDLAPQPLFYDPTLAPIVVYEFMAGDMWDRHQPTPAELGQLADYWLQMTNVPTTGLWLSHGQERTWPEIEASFQRSFRSYQQWAQAEFPSGLWCAERCLHLLESRSVVGRELMAMPTVLTFGRADSRFANVIRRPSGRLGMVDWEDSGLRDPARDLADLLTHSNQEDLLTYEAWQPFLQPYLAARGSADPYLWQRTHLYLAGFSLFWLSLLLELGVKRARASKLAGWQANGLPINQRLRRYLARALAWPELTFTNELDKLADIDFFPS